MAETTSLAAVLIVALAACSASGPRGRWADLPPDGSIGTLARVYDEAWTRAVVACPYDTPAQLTTRTGRDWAGPDLSARDDAQVVVLLDHGRLVGTETVPCERVDLCRQDLGDLAPDALVEVRVEDGTPVVSRPASQPASG